MSETDKKLSIEESLERIDGILNRMEAKETGLEESFRLYERGLKLIKDAESGIDQIEKEIRILNEEE